jgi:hypothetical protein
MTQQQLTCNAEPSIVGPVDHVLTVLSSFCFALRSTLGAYQQNYDMLAAALAMGSTVPAGPSPIDMRNHTLPFFGVRATLPRTFFDSARPALNPISALLCSACGVFQKEAPPDTVPAGQSFGGQLRSLSCGLRAQANNICVARSCGR